MTPFETAELINPVPVAAEGPAWRAAIAYGIDVSLLEHNLELTVAQRLLQLDEMTRLHSLLSPPIDATRPEDP